MPQIAVLDPGTKVPELDCFNRISRNSPLPVSYHLPAQQGMNSVHRVQDDIAAVIILGSGASVHDDEPWQLEMNPWLRERLHTLPMLGLCYGHQLLAHLLGGKVEYLFPDHTKLKGVRRVPLFADPLWGESRTVPMVVSHGEVVSALPPGCVVRGRSSVVQIEAFAHQEHSLWGFQPHPEATTAFTDNNSIPFDEDPRILAGGHHLVDCFTDLVGRRVGESSYQ